MGPDAPLEIPFRGSSGACSGGILDFLFGLVWSYLSVLLGIRAVLGACFRSLLTFAFRFLANVDFLHMYGAFCYVSWFQSVLFCQKSAGHAVHASEYFRPDGFCDLVVRCGGLGGPICGFWLAVEH